MPISVTETTGNDVYASPFLGPVDHVQQLPVDVSALLIDGVLGAQVDAKGYLKPGVPFKEVGGSLVPFPATPVAGEYVHGVTIEATKIVPENPTNASLGAVTTDPIVAVATHGQLNRDIVEDNLGRALHANEIAAFEAAGSQLNLTTT